MCSSDLNGEVLGKLNVDSTGEGIEDTVFAVLVGEGDRGILFVERVPYVERLNGDPRGEGLTISVALLCRRHNKDTKILEDRASEVHFGVHDRAVSVDGGQCTRSRVRDALYGDGLGLGSRL